MKVKFWGVRGSICAPGRETAGVGGNTSCVEISTSSGGTIVCDAGTGIRLFGLDYLKRPGATRTLDLFISHAHWDHIQGFPFFVPAMLADFTLNIYGLREVYESLRIQMKEPRFPLNFDDLKSNIVFHDMDGKTAIEAAGARITPFSLLHPQEVLGFRIEDQGKVVSYSSDTEHTFGAQTESFIEAIRGSDVLLYDAQYTPDEYSKGRIGWGHSTYVAATEIAREAGVKALVLFHHEPAHDDATIDYIESKAQELFPNTIAAREGLVLDV